MVVFIEPNDVENMKIAWVFTVGGDTTFTMGEAVSTQRNDEKMVCIRVHVVKGMNCTWCCVSSTPGGGRISLMRA